MRKSLFRTLGCEKALSDSLHPRYPRKLTSFMHVAFEILVWNRGAENYRLLYDRFLRFVVQEDLPDTVMVEFETVPASYNEHGEIGYALSAWNHGYGTTDHEARRRWADGLHVLGKFLGQESRTYHCELTKGLPMISIFPIEEGLARGAQ